MTASGALVLIVVSSAPPATATTPVPTAPPTIAAPTQTSPTGAAATPALVELTSLAPLDAAAGKSVTFEGTVTNRSDQPITALNAYLRLSRIPVVDRSDLARIGDPDFRPGARQAAFVPAADELAPGAIVSFRLDVPTTDLRLVEPGVYAAGIDVLATAADGSRGVVGQVMTALPWMPTAAAIGPIGVAVAWPVTAPVDRAVDGSYLSDDLGRAMRPGGRLAALLATSADAEVTWLVDPAVLEAAADLADGYEVRSDPVVPGSATAGSSGQDAAAWLMQVQRLADAGRVTLMPYADVDIVALERAGFGDEVGPALDAAAGIAQTLGLDRAGTPLDLLRPPAGLVDLPTAERLAAAGVTALLLDARNIALDGTAASARLEVAGSQAVSAVLVDDALRDLFTVTPTEDGTSAPATELGARQLLLAHTALTAIAAPSDTYVGQTVLVVSGDESSTISPASVLDALDQDVPWMQQVPLGAVQASPAAVGKVAYPDEAAAHELSGAYLAGAAALEQKAVLLAALTGGVSAPDAGPAEPSGLDPVTAAHLRLTSAAWRSEPVRAGALVAESGQAFDAEVGRVRILDGGSITLSSQTGRFPLTVVNDLTVPVTVELTLESQSPARLRVASVTGIQVPPGARTTVDVSAEANANGEYVVDAQLATTTGTRFGSISTLTIRATDYDTVAWIVMGAAGGLLLIGSARRIGRRVRAARVAPGSAEQS